MKRQQHQKLCMFCGCKDETFGPINTEHFVPKALWDGKRPNGTRTVCAHAKCNTATSDDNEYLRDVLAMEEGNAHAEVKRLQTGKLKRKLQNSPGAVAKTLKTLRYIPQFSPSGLYLGHAPEFDVDWGRMERALGYVVKGIYYTATGSALTQDCVIRVIADRHTVPDEIRDHINYHESHMCDWQSFGDDVFCCRYVTTFDSLPRTIRCLMQFYATRMFFAEAVSLSLLEDARRYTLKADADGE